MPINPQCVGRAVEPVTRHYDRRDCILYALSVGAGFSDLDYCDERSLVVIPTFGVSASFEFLAHAAAAVGVDTHDVLHAGQALEWFAPLPPAGSLSSSGSIVAVYDKGPGRGALVDVEMQTEDQHGRVLFRGLTTLYCRGGGGFGGARGATRHAEEPGPDLVCERACPAPETPLLHRLLGDTHPLHIDQGFAEALGYPAPVMHGLCTYGYATRALIARFGEHDPSRLRSIEAQFARPLIPGVAIETQMWSETTPDGASVVGFRVIEAETLAPILTHGRARFGALTT